MPGAKGSCFENDMTAAVRSILEDGWAVYQASKQHEVPHPGLS